MIDPTMMNVVAQNVTDIATVYTAQQISDMVTQLVTNAFLKLITGLLLVCGLTATKIKELNVIAIVIMTILGTLAVFDFLRAILITITQSL